MRTSQNGIDLIKRFEGIELESYQDIAGIWTIGYGHTGPEVGPDQRITASEAEALLRHDLVSREKAVTRLTGVALNQNEFDALVSFIYNVGIGAYQRSTARRRLNRGNRMGAADAITWFNKATVNGVLREVLGLTRRRAAEKALFLTPVDPMIAQPENIDDSGRMTPVEDAPRRGTIGDSRTVQGAAVAGGAGVAASNMGRDASMELEELEEDIENGTGTSVNNSSSTEETSPDTDTEATIPTLEGEDETESDDTGGTDVGGEDVGGDETSDEADDETGDDTTGSDSGSSEGNGTLVEQPVNRPAAHDKHDADAQVQLALMIIIVLAVLFILYARIDDWFRYRR